MKFICTCIIVNIDSTYMKDIRILHKSVDMACPRTKERAIHQVRQESANVECINGIFLSV